MQMIGDWAFGCDICQEVCPYNFTAQKKKRVADKAFMFIESERKKNQLLDLEEILSIKTNRQFEERFKESPILRARRSGLQRNAAAVLNNQILNNQITERC